MIDRQRRGLALTLAMAFALIGSRGLAYGAGSGTSLSTLAAFDAAFAKVDDYTVTMTAHEVAGSDVQDRVYHYWFKKPHQAKIEIVSGAGAGGGGVWTGTDQVRGHQGGLLSHFHLKVDLHDRRAVSLRGYTIPDGLFANEVDKYRQIKGELAQHDGPVIDGDATEAVELRLAEPAANAGVTRMVLDLSKKTHMPVRQTRYAGDQIVTTENWTDLKTNTGLTSADFPF
ncbi:MAG TPA: hypothetical protein VIG51_10440 [Candidatus Baltobacteraceae bacterium]|jgi:outer membrane lipoprotein-sorting protein